MFKRWKPGEVNVIDIADARKNSIEKNINASGWHCTRRTSHYRQLAPITPYQRAYLRFQRHFARQAKTRPKVVHLPRVVLTNNVINHTTTATDEYEEFVVQKSISRMIHALERFGDV